MNVVGGGSAPGAAPEASRDIREEIADERADERERFEEHREGGGGGFVDEVSRRAAPMDGRYRFDEETMAAKIREFEDLRDQIKDKRDELERAARAVTPPSYDPPAVAQARATRESILTAFDHNKAMWEYADAYVDALRQANGTYVAQEEDTAGVFKGGDDGGVPPGTGTLFQ